MTEDEFRNGPEATPATAAIQEAADKLSDLILAQIAPVKSDDDSVTHGFNAFLADKQIAIQQNVADVLGNIESWNVRQATLAEHEEQRAEEEAAEHEAHAEAPAAE